MRGNSVKMTQPSPLYPIATAGRHGDTENGRNGEWETMGQGDRENRCLGDRKL